LCCPLAGNLSELPGWNFHADFQTPGPILEVVHHEKKLFGMFLAFLVVFNEKNVVGKFLKAVLSQLKLLDLFQLAWRLLKPYAIY